MQAAPTRKRRLAPVKLALLAATMVVGLTACLNPIQPTNRPTIPSRQTNGAMNQSLLVNVFGCVVHKDAAKALGAMSVAAGNAGVVVRGSSCYRSYSGQVAARDQWCSQGACGMAAVPGTSNHGWGKAIDFSTNGSMTFSSPAYQWMKANAWKFGWNHPAWAEPGGSAPEPWHWEWVGDGGTMYPGTSWGPR